MDRLGQPPTDDDVESISSILSWFDAQNLGTAAAATPPPLPPLAEDEDDPSADGGVAPPAAPSELDGSTSPATDPQPSPEPAVAMPESSDFKELENPAAVSQWERPRPRAATNGAGASGSSSGGGRSGAHGHAPQRLPVEPLRAMEVLLRPDVSWQTIAETFESVMLAGGLLIRKAGASQNAGADGNTESLADGFGSSSRRRSSSGDSGSGSSSGGGGTSGGSSSGSGGGGSSMMVAERPLGSGAVDDWCSVTMRLGVTPAKLRVLLVRFYPETKRGGPVLNLGVPQRKLPRRGGDRLWAALAAALVERQLTLSCLSAATEVALDPAYVKDLVDMYAYENLASLAEYALPLERFIHVEEVRSAELVATLLPAYRAAGIAVPRPRRRKPLSAYPLDLQRGSLEACGLVEARQLIEEARGSAFLNGSSAGSGSGSDVGGESAAARGVQKLIRLVWREIAEWCAEEAKARIRRKDAQVRDRLRAVEEYRENVIATLRDSPAAKCSAAAKEFGSRFRPMADESLLAVCSAAHDSRPGRLYVTASHVAFHGGLLGFAWQKVLPLLSLKGVRIEVGGLGMGSLVMEDAGGTCHVFAITGMEPRQVERMLDLVQQVLTMARASAAQRQKAELADTAGPLSGDSSSAAGNVQMPVNNNGAAEQETAAVNGSQTLKEAEVPAVVARSNAAAAEEAYHGDVDDNLAILEKVKREARLRYKAAAAEAAAADERAHASAGDAVGGSSEADLGLGLNNKDSNGAAAAEAERRESADEGATQSIAAPRDATGGQQQASLRRGGPRSKMAQGIQAFLEQSQSRKPSL